MNMYYTKEHEWIKFVNDYVEIGVTPYAQEQLGDIVFVELPAKNKTVFEGDLLVVIESVKAAGEVKSPISGVVVMANEMLDDRAQLVNEDPITMGWLVRIRPNDPPDTSQWMSAADYEKFVSALG